MISTKSITRERSKIKIRKTLSGNQEKPRLSVYRSLNHIYASFIDDTKGSTLLSVSSKSKDIIDEIKILKGKVSKSKMVGIFAAKKAQEKGITTIVFDRNGYKYHGRVKAVADGAREGGLKF